MKAFLIVIGVLFALVVLGGDGEPRHTYTTAQSRAATSGSQWADEVNRVSAICRAGLASSESWSAAENNKIASAISPYRRQCKAWNQGDTEETKVACANLHFSCNKWYR